MARYRAVPRQANVTDLRQAPEPAASEPPAKVSEAATQAVLKEPADASDAREQGGEPERPKSRRKRKAKR